MTAQCEIINSDFILAPPIEWEVITPACEQAEWLFLIFLFETVNTGNYPKMPVSQLYSQDTGQSYGNYRLIKKTRDYGLGTYLCPDFYQNKIWIAASGYHIGYQQHLHVDDHKIYPYRPLMEDPDKCDLREVKETFDLPTPNIFENQFYTELDAHGYMGLMNLLINRISAHAREEPSTER